ncbi:MAG: hypothetical protein C0593_01205 [Marinilabiliales bacterium]|nr:MAG: hypothetical protein C0593_01205 [Marinilabiliales bacterium]
MKRFLLWQLFFAIMVLPLTGIADTIIVTNTDDSGTGSLRQAVLDAAPGDTISFSVSGTITLTSGEVTLDKDLFILGPGSELLTINGNNASSIFANEFSFSEKPVLHINDLSFAYAYSPDGFGALGLYSDTLSIKGCNFSNSEAKFGGGVYFHGDYFLLDSCQFDNNQCINTGGAIYIEYSNTATVSNSSFSSNNSSTNGGAVGVYLGNCDFQNCDFQNNICGNSGGGIFSQGNEVNIIYCNFMSNQAEQGGGYMSFYSEVQVLGSMFSNNSATEKGGAVFLAPPSVNPYPATISNSSMLGNTASLDGGAIYCRRYDLTLKQNTIAGNEAEKGGGIYLSECDTATMQSLAITGNLAAQGGAFYIEETPTALDHLSISGNEVTGNGTAIYNDNSVVEATNTIIFDHDGTPVVNDLGQSSFGNCLLENSGGSAIWNGLYGIDLGGNIDADPAFHTNVSSPAPNISGDLHLNTHSICINKGLTDNDYRDLEEKFCSGLPDIGCYELPYELTWTGAENETWDNENNWGIGFAHPAFSIFPTSGNDDIVISPTAHNPIISNNSDNPVLIGKLVVEADAEVSVAAGGSLSIYDTLNLTQGNLNLKSQNDATASLITYGHIIGQVHFEKYISDSQWHLISMPVENAKAIIFREDYLQYYEDGNWVEISDITTPLIPMVGYSLWDNAKSTTYAFQGTPNTGEVTFPVTSSYGGWNLMGNPYPSSIDWALLDDSYGAIYFWDPENQLYVNWNNNVGSGIQFVPPMQGFWVNASTDTVFSLDNSMRTHQGNSAYYKAPKGNENILKLIAFNDAFQDSFHFLFTEDASNGFDLQYDAYKMLSYAEEVPQLFSVSNGSRLSIDRRPECDYIELGFRCENSGEFSIMIAENSLKTKILLEDTKTGSVHDLSTAPYSFDYVALEHENRFIIHFGSTGIFPENTDATSVFANQKKVTILHNDAGEYNELIIYSITGAKVFRNSILSCSKQTILTTLSPGIYIAKIRGNNREIHCKIHVQ